jgi:hypothetical protein
MTRTDRRRSNRDPLRSWLVAGAAGFLAFGLGFAVAQVTVLRPPPAPSAGLAVGALVPTLALPATTGGVLSLDRLRGSKVIVYFYEGAG